MNDIQKSLVKKAGKKVDELIDFKKILNGKLQIVGVGVELFDDNIFTGILGLGFKYLPTDLHQDYADFLQGFIDNDKEIMADNLGDITAHYLNAEKIDDDLENAFFDQIFVILIGLLTDKA